MTKRIKIDSKNVPITLIAETLGWSYRKALRWVRKNSCGVRIGGRWFVTKDKLFDNFQHLRMGDHDQEDYTT